MNRSLMKMSIKSMNRSLMNVFIKIARFINEHVHQNRFINEYAKYNFSSPQFHRQLAGSEAFWRACCLLLVLKCCYFVFMHLSICWYLHNAISFGRVRAVGTDTYISYELFSYVVLRVWTYEFCLPYKTHASTLNFSEMFGLIRNSGCPR